MKQLYVASFSLAVLTIILVAARFGSLPPFVPLFYSKPWGEEQLISKIALFAVPLLILIFLFINMGLAKAIAGNFNNSLVSLILSGLSILVALLGTITVLRILFLV